MNISAPNDNTSFLLCVKNQLGAFKATNMLLNLSKYSHFVLSINQQTTCLSPQPICVFSQSCSASLSIYQRQRRTPLPCSTCLCNNFRRKPQLFLRKLRKLPIFCIHARVLCFSTNISTDLPR